MQEAEAIERARALFLDDDNLHGCAETTCLVLCEAFGVGDPADSSIAMALNGGVAYTGGPCGAITGAALAIGLLAGARIEDHKAAKRAARGLTAGLIDSFRAEHGATDCLALTGYDLRAPGGHEAFVRSGIWRDRCMRQIESAVRSALPLADVVRWAEAVAAAAPDAGPGSGER